MTPAARIVSPHQETRDLFSTPRQLYFNPTRYANLQTVVRRDYVGPSPDSLRTAFSSAMTGQQLAIPAAYSNMSYTLNFLGPALRCDPIEASFVHEVYAAYLSQLTGIENEFRYIAWVPVANNQLKPSDSNTFLDLMSIDTAHLYVIPNTSSAGPIMVGGQLVSPHDTHYGY